MPLTDIEARSTDGATLGEMRQWHEDHPDLRSWVPSSIADATWGKLQAFTGWFDIVKRKSSEKMWHVNDITPCMNWLWISTEHLTRECVFELLREGVEAFHQGVAWCSVYSSEMYMKYTKAVEKAVTDKVNELSRPIALAKLRQVLWEEEDAAGTMSGPAEVPHDIDFIDEFSCEK